MMIEWLFTPWLPYYYTAALTAIGVALALRAYTVAREHKRRLLMRALGAIVLIGLCIALGSIYKQFPPLSPLFLAAGLSGCWLLFVLGIERVEELPVPTPRRTRVHALGVGQRIYLEALSQRAPTANDVLELLEKLCVASGAEDCSDKVHMLKSKHQ